MRGKPRGINPKGFNHLRWATPEQWLDVTMIRYESLIVSPMPNGAT
jgi:hypothetical protein